MSAQLPAHGLPILMAIRATAEGQMRKSIDLYDYSVTILDRDSMTGFISLFWAEVQAKIVLTREWRLTGVLVGGELRAIEIPTGLVAVAKISPAFDSITTDIGVFTGLLVLPAPEPLPSFQARPNPAPKPLRAGPLNYGEDDHALVAEMRQMIERGRASGPLDAARAVSDRAEGNGNPESKAKRLLRRYQGEFSTQSGQY